ncbi:response regulator [Aquabacter spiritensis]|uniref:histidine kinase n=1 Tax=Aquabacter spiritensis TaxID=933073 RepID=A0A4V2UXK9_9HYPH|nr:response regulator [Aquabacter spiritensis]TCT03928.1 PAS domain S-box-containing protein [Aquabacter spiritensis]
MALAVQFLTRPRSLAWRLAIAIIVVGVLAGLRLGLGLSPLEVAPFALQMPGLLLVTLLGGLWVGLFGLCLAFAANAAMLPIEIWLDFPAGSTALVSLGLFGLNGLILCFIAAALRHVLRELTRTQDSLGATAQVQAETLATLTALLDHAPVGFAFFDRSHRFVRVNGRVADLNVMTAEAHVGRTVRDIAPDYAEDVNRYVDQVFASGRVISAVEIEGAVPASPGVVRHWLTGFFPVRDAAGAVSLVGIAVVEITERKVAERALAESVKRFRNLAEALPQMVWTTDAGGKGDYYNDRWAAYTGGTFGAGHPEWDAFLHPDDREDALANWRAALSAAQPFGREYRLRGADGSFKWFLCRALPVRAAGGAVERWFGTCTDITEIVDAREALAKSREELERLIDQRTAELIAANARLKAEIEERIKAEDQLRQAQKMEAVGQLTGGVAHDFNNLLTVIIGNLEAAERRVAPTETEIRTFLDYSRQGALRAATLTQRLLAFSRRQPLDPKPTDVNRLVTVVSEMLRRTLGERVLVETVLAGGLWRAEIDPNQLESAMLNLAVNARDAMPNGGKLTIETANAYLDEAYAAAHEEVDAGQYVVVCVSDTGSGMPPEVLERAFEPFFTTKGPSEGTGLGLSQVYGFVKQSGGHVKIYSEIGEGTTVKIYLPRLRGAHAPVSPSRGLAALPRCSAKTTILVVEDEASVRNYSVSVLSELGYDVAEAGSAEEAIAILSGGLRPHLLFTDVNLGGLNGRDLAERAMAQVPGLKVLFTTAYAPNAIVHHGRLERGVKLLTKPFNQAELAGKVRDVLEQPEPRGTVLLVEDEPFVAMVARQILEDDGFVVNLVGTAAAALAVAQTDAHALAAAVVDVGLPDLRGDELLRRLRAIRADLPILVASGYGTGELQAMFAADERVALVAKPYDSAALRKALATLGFDFGKV